MRCRLVRNLASTRRNSCLSILDGEVESKVGNALATLVSRVKSVLHTLFLDGRDKIEEPVYRAETELSLLYRKENMSGVLHQRKELEISDCRPLQTQWKC